MILCCDTSALLKLFVAEEGSDMVRAAARQAAVLAVCRIAWAEAAAALARRSRERPADASVLQSAKRQLSAAWTNCFIVEVTQGLVEAAGELADAFALRAYDAVQLAAALSIRRGTTEEMRFACFDARLRKAARALGMESLPAE